MPDEINYIDDLVKGVLENRVVDLPQNNWELIESSLPRYSFWQFNYRSLNAWYVGSLATIILVLLLFFHDFSVSNRQNSENSPELKAITSVTKEKQQGPQSVPGVTVQNDTTKKSLKNKKNTDLQDNEYVHENKSKKENNTHKLINKIKKAIVPVKQQPVTETQVTVQLKTSDTTISKTALKVINEQAQLKYFEREYFKIDQMNSLKYKESIEQDRISSFPGNRKYDGLLSSLKDMESKTPEMSVDVFFSPIYSINHLSTGNQDYQNVVSEQKNMEKPVLSYSAGVGFNIMLNSNLMLQTGLSYTRIASNLNRKSSTKKDSTLYDTTVRVMDTAWFYNINIHHTDWSHPDSIIHYFTGNYADSTAYHTHSKKISALNIINSFTYLEVPLVLSYQIRKSLMTFSVKGGIITGFILNASGETITQGDQVTQINNIPFMKPTFSYTFGAGMTYQVTEKIYLLGDVYYRKNFSSIYRDYPLIEKYETYGLKFGLRYAL
ncbi:MAG: hypothetical protein NTW49_06390 [Bacteroidia bacterium]|nr:hypothetical protein [Bacteroidia bacterium]